ncbi:MAG TPA: hypothetical protein VKU85_04680, partial [bacterium]|nr:hypothetical protein [bacterium]
AVAAAGCGGTSKELLLAGPLPELPDRNPVAEPAPAAPNQYYDFADRTVFRAIHAWFDVPRHVRWIAGAPKEAINVDAFDEVPNSSWFTNRGERLSDEEALRGPNLHDGPDTSAPWRVRGVKTQGVTPGFRVKDARGDTYLLKFDPLTNPEMGSGAEIISTKLAWAAGYNTPENYLVFFTPEQLFIEDDVTITTEFGEERTLTPDDVESILERVPRAPDGTIRAVASKFLPGKPMGPYSYLGTRKDDPNDVFRHEHRRELRGLYVFASWINHNDIRRINSLDMFDPDGFMKHYLIDFGSTLGSASIGPNLPSEGFEYQVDFEEMGKSLVGLGLRKRPWRRVDLHRDPAVGYWGAEGFDPGDWKPNYPNMAFARRTARDGFWGAKQVMSFDDRRIRGIVVQARYSDPDVAAFLTETLIERRDAIGRHWCGRVCPLDRFRLQPLTEDGQRVTWVDRAVQWGFEDPAAEYRVELFHNDFGGRDEPIGKPVMVGASGMREAADRAGGAGVLVTAAQLQEVEEISRNKNRTDRDRLFYLKIRVRRGVDEWGRAVKAHLLWVGTEAGFDLAGVERE